MNSERIAQIAGQSLPPCHCIDGFKDRGMIDPQCQCCNNIGDVETAIKTALREFGEELAKEADAVRLRFSSDYEKNIAADCAQTGGNMDWARLEGSVRTVEAIRSKVSALTGEGE